MSAQLGQFSTSGCSTAGKPSSRGPQTTFTVNHKPQSKFYEEFKGFVELTLYNINKWDVVWVRPSKIRKCEDEDYIYGERAVQEFMIKLNYYKQGEIRQKKIKYFI